MGAVELKIKINEYLDRVDSSFLNVIHAMLDAYVKENDSIIGYDTKGKPLYASEAKRQFNKDLEAVERGEFVTIDELKVEAAEWLKPTK